MLNFGDHRLNSENRMSDLIINLCPRCTDACHTTVGLCKYTLYNVSQKVSIFLNNNSVSNQPILTIFGVRHTEET